MHILPAAVVVTGGGVSVSGKKTVSAKHYKVQGLSYNFYILSVSTQQ